MICLARLVEYHIFSLPSLVYTRDNGVKSIVISTCIHLAARGQLHLMWEAPRHADINDQRQSKQQ
jgi:hypothetical protein